MFRIITLFWCCLVISGCTLVPSLGTYKPDMPTKYSDQNTQHAKASPDLTTLNQLSWASFYQDKTLQKLIKMALAGNQDIKTSLLRICEARALYGIEKSNLLPNLIANGSFTRQRTNSSRSNFQQENNSGASIFNINSTDIGITSYELDFFGRLRSLKEAALNDYLSTVHAARNVHTALISDIATAYISLRKNQALLKLAHGTQRIRKLAFDLIQKQAQEGIITDLDVATAETILLQAAVDIHAFTDAVTQDKNQLRFLVGQHQELPDLTSRPDQNYFTSITLKLPVGLPSTLLYNRPDIQEAETNLKRANADIGAARAAFFPTISLTNSLGYTSRDLLSLFKKSSQIWSFMPTISIPIFSFGRLRNHLKLSQLRKEMSVVAYERTIENAFREVSDTLSTTHSFDKRIKIQERLVAATKNREKLSIARYKAGVENYLTALDSKRELYTANQNLIHFKANAARAKILLYKAVGGGLNICDAPL